MRKFFWALSAISSFFGGLVLLFGVMSANGAPQEAAIAAIAVGMAVIPYCLNRAFDEFDRPPLQKAAPLSNPVTARVATSVRCNQCSTIFASTAQACPGCGGHVLDSIPA